MTRREPTLVMETCIEACVMTVATGPIAPTAPTALDHARRDRVAFLDVPERCYLAVDGCERPGGQTFQNAIATLYPIAYTLHFALRRAGVRAPIGMLEGLFWLAPEDIMDEELATEETERAGSWSWRLLIPIPEAATEEDVERAVREAAERKTLPAFSRFHVLRWEEGPCAQLLHVGAYSAEGGTIARLTAAIAAVGLEPHGPHHEIWLNNPAQAGEDKARTIIRLAVRPRAGATTEGRP
jgi:hypothetical protein